MFYLIEEVKTTFPTEDPYKKIEECKYRKDVIFGDYTEFKENVIINCYNG